MATRRIKCSHIQISHELFTSLERSSMPIDEKYEKRCLELAIKRVRALISLDPVFQLFIIYADGDSYMGLAETKGYYGNHEFWMIHRRKT